MVLKYLIIGIALLLVSALFFFLSVKKGKKKLAADQNAKTRGQKFVILLTQGAVELGLFGLLTLFVSTLFLGGAFRVW